MKELIKVQGSSGEAKQLLSSKQNSLNKFQSKLFKLSPTFHKIIQWNFIFLISGIHFSRCARSLRRGVLSMRHIRILYSFMAGNGH